MIGFNITTPQRKTAFAALRLQGKSKEQAEMEMLAAELMHQAPRCAGYFNLDLSRSVPAIWCMNVYKQPSPSDVVFNGRAYKLNAKGEFNWKTIRKFSDQIGSFKTNNPKIDLSTPNSLRGWFQIAKFDVPKWVK